jgi:hypothetical protein
MSSMPQLTEKGAKQVADHLDRIANLFQKDHSSLGVEPKVAMDFALRCDILADHIEKQAGLSRTAAEGGMNPKQNYTEGKNLAPHDFPPQEIGMEQDGALLRNEDEPYMDVFKQDEFDQLREVQQTGMFSNAKAASSLVKKMAKILAENGIDFSKVQRSNR